MLERGDWLELSRKLDWEFSYVTEREVFPAAASGEPWLSHAAGEGWDEPHCTTYRQYVAVQHRKAASLSAVCDTMGKVDDSARLDRGWLSTVKLHGATLALAEFAAVIGNLKAARFGRDSAWRAGATLGALDELRHAQIPLAVLHQRVPWDAQFDWTHRLLHTNHWVAIAARHMIDELLLTSDPIELAIAKNFVLETGFTHLQLVGLSALAQEVGDGMFETMARSIQTDEARDSQLGDAVMAALSRHDAAYVQRLVDKWFWRTWLFFSIGTGFAMDYLTPLAHRRQSFKEFVEEWVLQHFRPRLAEYGLSLPTYWGTFESSLEHYHHMVYLSVYTYRASLWFDCPLPGPVERAWLADKYPASFPAIEPMWREVVRRTQKAGPGVEWYTHGTTPFAFCDLCQLLLCGGTPSSNSARTRELAGRSYVFCSEPCEAIFKAEPERYAEHRSVIGRILAGEAPGNLLELLRSYFGLEQGTWGKDLGRGRYAWMENSDRASSSQPGEG